MKLYMHKTTIEYWAYTEFLEKETGLSWSTTGEQQDRMGFERGDFDKLVEDKRAGLPDGSSIELVIGQPFRVKSNMDPHGLS